MNGLTRYQLSLNIRRGNESKASVGKETPFVLNSSLRVGRFVSSRISGKSQFLITHTIAKTH